MGVYDFYTGTRTGDEVNVGVIVTWNGNYETAKQYIENKSNTAKSIKLSSLTEETINGTKWYAFSNDNAYYYAAEFGENLYEVTVTKKKDSKGLYEPTNEMVKKTLFFIEGE